MYISTANYEEMYLKGKSEEEVFLELSKIRREMERLKNKMESPTYSPDIHLVPSDMATVGIYRGYLETAQAVLAKIKGVDSVLDENERKAKEMQERLGDISCITLTFGEYLEQKYELTLDGGRALITEIHLGKNPISKEISFDSAMNFIKEIHIGEWRDVYSVEEYGCSLNEPIKWQVRIDFGNKYAPVFYDGLGVFPYNFDLVCKFFGAEIN